MGVNSLLKRVAPLWWLRNRARGLFFSSVRHIASIQESRDILSTVLRAQNVSALPAEIASHRGLEVPYPELRRERSDGGAGSRSDVIFITGRFRSGSTLVWNLFRNIPGVTSYYEPFNERRWFDPGTRGTQIDQTHLNVSDYWSEYSGLEVLGEYFSPHWKFQHLYMTADAWNPAMQRFIEIMIERAKGRAVLQFNEVDFRLPWLRARFPLAKILHVYRHPRDQWCSTLGKDLKSSTGHTLAEFAEVDGFYLCAWGADLRRCFPFLTLDARSHPYELFYQLWKLSYLFGKVYADISVSFEDIVASPDPTLKKVFGTLAVAEADTRHLVPLVSSVQLGKWRSYATDDWFAAIEQRVDRVFEDYSRVAGDGVACDVAVARTTNRRPRLRA